MDLYDNGFGETLMLGFFRQDWDQSVLLVLPI